MESNLPAPPTGKQPQPSGPVCGEPTSGPDSAAARDHRPGRQDPRTVDGARSLFMQKRLERFLELLLSFLTLCSSNFDSPGLTPSRGPRCLEPVGRGWGSAGTTPPRGPERTHPAPSPPVRSAQVGDRHRALLALPPGRAPSSADSSRRSPSAWPAWPWVPPTSKLPFASGVSFCSPGFRTLRRCLLSVTTRKWGPGQARTSCTVRGLGERSDFLSAALRVVSVQRQVRVLGRGLERGSLRAAGPRP